MKFGILCGFPFPIGFSGTNRVISLSRGLVENGADVTVFIFKATEIKNNVINNSSSGKYMGVNFKYPQKRTIKPRYRILKLLDFYLGLFRTLININKSNKHLPFDSIIISYDDPFFLLVVSFILKIIKIINISFIVDEYPPIMRSKNRKNVTFFQKKMIVSSLRNIDNIISMTYILLTYYSTFFNKKGNIKTIVVPMTVEPQRFINIKNTDITKKYIAYIGNFDISKDGVDILIHAYNKIYKEFPEIELHLAGVGAKADMEMCQSIVSELQLNEKVKFIGKLHRDDVPEFMCNAKILVMARPWSERSSAGFPTKLGEYLSTGVPTIITDVGEIKDYLIHNENCFIVEPGSIEAFANQMKKVVINYEKSLLVAKQGKKIANTVFNYKFQGERIINFFNNEV